MRTRGSSSRRTLLRWRDDVRSFSISPYFQPEIGYYAAAVSPSSDRATAYVERLAGYEAQAALGRAGFFPAPS